MTETLTDWSEEVARIAAADAVAFLASPAGSFIAGADLLSTAAGSAMSYRPRSGTSMPSDLAREVMQRHLTAQPQAPV
jgi:hypothetical protein